jgi:hypothetical protein
MPCFQLCPRIIRNAETGTETGRAEEKVRFLESTLGREEEQATSESNQAKPTTSHRYWAKGGAAGQR